MLTPEELEYLPYAIAKPYLALEDFIISDVARRTKKASGMTDTTEYLMWRAKELGQFDKVNEAIEKAMQEVNTNIDNEFETALTTAFNRDSKVGEIVGIQIGNEVSRDVKATIIATMENMKDWNNGLTNSIGMNGRDLKDFYRQTLDDVYFSVANGVESTESAVRRACRTFAKSGIQKIYYESGVTRTIEAATRTAIRTTLAQTSNKISEMVGDEIGADGWEISAHSGARPSHKEFQGKIFARYKKDATSEYPFYDAVVGNGLDDFNCRHVKFGVILGISEPSWSKEALDNIDPLDFKYEGKNYNAYEATQKQRQIERDIRYTKRSLIANKGAKDEEMFRRNSVALKEKEKQYKEFSNVAGLKLQKDRLQVVDFDRSISQQAVWASKKAAEDEEKKNLAKGLKATKNNDKIKKNNLSKELTELTDRLDEIGVEYNKVKMHDSILSDNKIINAISGNDTTEGSCASLGLAYIGQKGGMNVVDFRGGESQEYFSKYFVLKNITKFPNVDSVCETAKSSVAVGNKLLKKLEKGKEYYLVVGKHASIVRKTNNNVLQYLELQSENGSGWVDFKEKARSTLFTRFGCNTGRGNTEEGFLIDVVSLKGSEELKELLGYINTDVNK